jgi:hypothetical protein
MTPRARMGRTYGPPLRPTGVRFPFEGQPVLGISSLRAAAEGGLWALQDNGFGGKANSADAMLALHRLVPDWETGGVARAETVFLADPDAVLPFPIAGETTAARYLTGADLDPEGLALADGLFWVADEFGPFLLAFDRRARLVFVAEAGAEGRALRSPDHPAIRTPDRPGHVRFEVGRSRGFEGLASGPGGLLHAILEGPLLDPETGEAPDPTAVPVLEFDPEARAWTGQARIFRLADPDFAVGGLAILPDGRALVIERDRGQGSPALACPEGEPAADCFATPARVKRLVLVDLLGTAPGGTLGRLGEIDLLGIPDPEARARQGRRGGRLDFPFVTVEGVAVLPGGRIAVANDNNLPNSSGRAIGRADDTEIILLETRLPAP